MMRRQDGLSLLHPWVVPWPASVPRTLSTSLLGLPRADEPGIAVGDSARFLAEAAKLALELLARGRVLPTLERRDDQWLARWQPVTIDPGDSARVRLLAESMPPLLRAEVGSSEHGRRSRGGRGRRARRGRRRVCATLPVRRSARAARTASVALGRRGVARGADGRRPRRAGGRAGARGARRAARRVASGDGALRRAPDVPDLLSAVGAGGAHRAAGGGPRGRCEWRWASAGAVAGRDHAAGQGRPERARPGAGCVELERRRAARRWPPDRGSAGAVAGRAWPRSAPVARARAGVAGTRADSASSSTRMPPSASCATLSRRSSRRASGCWRRRGGASGCVSS